MRCVVEPSLLLELRSSSAPFYLFGFGAALSRTLQPLAMMDDDGASSPRTSIPSPDWHTIIAPCWISWLQEHSLRFVMPPSSECNVGSLLLPNGNSGEGSLGCDHRWAMEAAGDLCVLSYVLETAMRRVMWWLATNHKKGKSGGALHSVLLSDISRGLLDGYGRLFPSAGEGGGSGAVVLLDQQLRALHREFVDPTADGLNLRNLIQHGFLVPLTPRNAGSEMPPAIKNGDGVHDLSLRLLHVVRQRLLHHIGVVAGFAALVLLRLRVPTEAKVEQQLPVPLPTIRLEREPRRQEAVDTFVDVLSGDFVRIPPPPRPAEVVTAADVVGHRAHHHCPDTCCNPPCARGHVASVLTLFPQVERSIRLIVAAATARRSGQAEEAPSTAPFSPIPGQHFSDMEALFQLASLHLDSAVLEHAVGGACLRSGGVRCPASPPLHWSWWEAILVAPDGPRVRDVLVHSKWDPLAADSGESVVSCQALEVFEGMLAVTTESLDEFIFGERSLVGRTSCALHALQQDLGMRPDRCLSSLALVCRRVHHVWVQLSALLSSPFDLHSSHLCLVRAAKTSSTKRCIAAALIQQCRDPGSRDDVCGIDVAQLSITAAAQACERITALRLHLCADYIPAVPSESLGEIHVAIFAWVSFITALDERATELTARIAARKAREQQRQQLVCIDHCRQLVNDLASVCVCGIIASAAFPSSTEVLAPNDVRRRCRGLASLLATSNVGSLAAVLDGLLELVA